MDEATEIEHKFDVPEGFVLPDLTVVAAIRRVGPPTVHELDAVYFDTADGQLAEHDVVLRRRTGGGDEGWHIKVGGVAEARTEIRRPLTDAQTPPADLIAAIPFGLGDQPLQAIARVQTRRSERAAYGDPDATLASIAQDEVRAERLTDAVRSTWQEVEVELVDGDPTILAEVDEVMLAAGARRGSVNKLHRAMRGGQRSA